jgi:murein DD-endopeptidase MepM/ murein hydrolase activator NlpD
MLRIVRVTAPALVAVLAATFLTAIPSHAAAYPTWDDVVAARSSEAATAEKITELTGLLEDLRQQSETLTATAEKRGLELQEAQDATDAATQALRDLADDVARAEDDADQAERQISQWAASLSRTGGTDVSMNIAVAGADAGDLLSRLGTASQLSKTSNRMLGDATAAANTAAGLRDQAQVATSERDRLEALAETARDEALDAAKTAQTAVAEQELREIELEAQLAVLKQETASVEQGFAEAEAARAKAAAEAAARAAAARAAAAAAAAPAPAAPASSSVSSSGWTMPITSYSSYQAYGMRIHPVLRSPKLHAGADFGASCGNAIFAATAGTVTYAGAYGGYGNLITVTSADGVSTNYAHMFASGVQVAVGQQVTAGQQIAVVGNAGLSTGCHLHFELRQGGAATDPIAYLNTKGV